MELLKTNFYRRIFQLNLGSQHGNGEVNVRSILLKRFYKKREINLTFFNGNIKYNNKKLSVRIKKINYFFLELYKLDNFNISFIQLIKKIHTISKKLCE